ncbi:uncharacterized protein EI90DRAFT_3049256 [Cantharellus anzutake]|uniref:uncharacterized protein n=1 Tax=Cantharellus anzutake TaxID=1750568 RepID=UPI00190895F7|nr:uncharacterized protein EI90DRAFT_3049256 [Cantharellus anzutake]KAF8335038.1 hypothetical protein EI90DRAFT_3049256 [Cantharellus anzutake]
MSNPLPPIVIVRLPYDRPHDGGLRDPIPVRGQVQSISTHAYLWILGQYLAAHLVVPLPYLLYKTQARYEEDLRKIYEVKPVIPTATIPRVLNEDGKRIPTPSRRTSSRAETIVTVPRSPGNLDKLVLPTLSTSRIQSAGTAVRSPTTLLKNAMTGSAIASKPLSSSSSSSDPESEITGDEGDRQKEEREDVNRRLKELEKLVNTDGFGFAAGSSGAYRGKLIRKGKERQKETPSMSDVPETGESGREEEPESPPTPDYTSAGTQSGGKVATFMVAPRTSRFSRDAIPSIPSGSPGRVANVRCPPGQNNIRTTSIPSRNRSLSSHGSQASSFSDLSDASISASALEDTVLSGGGGASRF